MRKFVLSLAALSLMLVPVASHAFHGSSTVRTDGFAIDSEDTHDYGNIYKFPHLYGKYANILAIVPVSGGFNPDGLGELIVNWKDKTIYLGLDSGQTDIGGVDYENEWWNLDTKFDNYGFLGNIYFGATDVAFGSVFDEVNPVNPDKRIALGLAMPLGEGLFGFNVSYAMTSHTEDYVVTDGSQDDIEGYEENWEDKSNVFAVGVGFGKEEVGPFAMIDLGAMVEFGSGESTYFENRGLTAGTTGSLGETQTAQADGALGLGIALRGSLPHDNGSECLINLGFRTASVDLIASYVDDGDDDGSISNAGDVDESITRAFSATEISLGGAHNMPINDDGLFVISAGLQLVSWKYEDSFSIFDYNTGNTITSVVDMPEVKGNDFIIPIAIGVEEPLIGGFTGRLGIRKDVWITEKSEMDTLWDFDSSSETFDNTDHEEMAWSYASDATVHTGLGLVVGDWYVDFRTSLDLLFDGAYFVTGSSSSFAQAIEVGKTW